jgi:hypothetical protein
MQQEREALGQKRTHGPGNYGAYTPDRLPLTQPERWGGSEHVSTEIEGTEEVEIPDALRPAYDALVTQRDELQDQAVPLRQQLADLEQGIERVQGAIDALEGREPDASASLRAPGSLQGRLPAEVRNAFSASRSGHAGRVTLNTEQVAEVRAALLEALPIGEDHAIDRSELTERVNRVLSFEIDKARVSRQLVNLIEANDAARNSPDNPKDVRYWRPENADQSEGEGG